MIKVISETIQWDAIAGTTSYDLLINGVKKSSTKTALQAKFALSDGDIVRVVAQPSGEWQEITFDYTVEVDVPTPKPTESPDNTVILGTLSQIVDANGHIWKISSAGKVNIDGVDDTITSNVIKLAYESKKIWQENTSNMWWYKILTTDTWLPAGGTAVSPIPGDVPPPPVTSGRSWGICPGSSYVPALATWITDWKNLNALCPRIGATIGGGSTEAALIAAGINKWVAWGGNTGYMWTPAQAVAYLQKFPQCVGLELGNELNLNGAWTVKAVADMQKAYWAAAVSANVQSRVMLASVGNSLSKPEGLSMLNWCKGLASNGVRSGSGFTISNYHNYGANPTNADNWNHCWTPNSSGESCQSVLGNPPFFVTEFGAKIGWSDTPDAATQAKAATLWIAQLAAQAHCIGGMWFTGFDGTVWGGFGLSDANNVRRPSWQTYHDAVAGNLTIHVAKALSSAVHPDATDLPTLGELEEFAAQKQQQLVHI